MSAKKMADIFFGKFSEIVSPKNLNNNQNISLNNDKQVIIEEKTERNNFNKKVIFITTIFLILVAFYLVIK